MTTAWERTGRPKPPLIYTDQRDDYWADHPAYVVWRSRIHGMWYADGPGYYVEFPTFAEAIAYAQQQARKDTP